MPIRRLNGHTAKVMALAVSPDERIAASGGWDRTVRLWDLSTGVALWTIHQPSNLSALAFSADGRLLFSGDVHGVLRTWRVSDGSQIVQKKAHDWGVTRLVVSPDGRRMLSASIDETVKLRELAGLKERAVLRGHEGPGLRRGIRARRPDGAVRWPGREHDPVEPWRPGRRSA